jgi:ribosomal protein L18
VRGTIGKRSADHVSLYSLIKASIPDNERGIAKNKIYTKVVFRVDAMIKQFNSNKARLRRHQRMRRRLIGSQARPRLNIFRSGYHIYAQVIDDTTGRTLASASSLDENLRDFKIAQPDQDQPSLSERVGDALHNVAEKAVEVATDILPGAKGKGAKAEKPAKAPAKGGSQKGGTAQPKIVLPSAQKGTAKTQVEALAAIASNRKVALAREVGKLVAQRAKEQGVKQVVFDRGGYAYHGRVAALAEGAREVGLDF